MKSSHSNSPLVTGISPHQGVFNRFSLSWHIFIFYFKVHLEHKLLFVVKIWAKTQMIL